MKKKLCVKDRIVSIMLLISLSVVFLMGLPVVVKGELVLPVTGVTIDKSKLILTTEDEPYMLTATVLPEEATEQEATWSSSDEAVATVIDGEVMPLAPGEAIITVTTIDGEFMATCRVTVNASAIPVSGVTLDKSELILTVEDEPQILIAIVLPEDAIGQGVTWSSSNEEVATVTDGLVTPLVAGETTINVTTNGGGFTASCEVIVSEVKEPQPMQMPLGMSPMGANTEYPLISSESLPVDIDYEVNDGYGWVYSDEYSSDVYYAYIAGNSFSNQTNVSNIAITVDEPGLFSFDYKVSTPSSGSQYGLYYSINNCIDGENYKQTKNYNNYPDFVGVRDWSPVEFNIYSDDLIDGQATVYIAYVRKGTFSNNENMVAIANVCFTSGEKQVTLNIDGNDYGYVIDADNHSYNEGENTLYYTSGDTVTLTAESDAGARFYGWVDGSNKFLSSDEAYTFTIASDASLRAVFAPESHYAAQCNGTFYTGNDGGLAKALIDAGEGDVVVMLENQLLTENTTIPTGATLYIPYGPFFDEDGNADGDTTTGSYDKASTKIAASDKTYRTLTIEEDVKLIINGTLNIGSVISYPSQYYQGHTSGWHGKIINDGEIVVTDGGTLDSWGLIVGNGTVTANSGSAVYEPFIVYDFAGGWNTAELYFDDQSPFKQYAMQNIQNEFTINYGAILYGRCNLWATSQYNKVDIVFIGEEGMYQLADDASVTRTYDGIKRIVTNTDIGKMTYTFKGGMTLMHLSMPILGVAISTADVEFPIPYNWSIVLQNGDYQYDGRSKLMPGATLRIESDANLSVNATLFILDGLIQSDMSGKFYPTTATLQNAGFSGSGQLVVNGQLIVKEGARFGGIVQTEMDANTATIAIESGALVNNKDVKDGAVGEYDANTSIFDLPTRAYIYDQNKGIYNLKRLYPGRAYTSYDNTQWQMDSYSMTYAVNTTLAEWDREGPVVDGKYHNWVTTIIGLNEERNGSWYSEGEIYHNINASNQTIYSDDDGSRTAVSNGELDDEIYEGGDITFTVDTTALDGQGYVYQVSYTTGSSEPTIITPSSQGVYAIEDIHDDITIYVISCKLGDIYQDNAVNNKDLVLLRKILVGTESPSDFQSLAADIYKDGKFDNKDLVQLRKILIGL